MLVACIVPSWPTLITIPNMALITPIAVLCALIFIILWKRNRASTSIQAYKGQGSPSFLSDAEAFAMRPVDLIQKATAQCGSIFSIQVLTVYNVWLQGTVMNKFYVDQREDVWSFPGGMVCIGSSIMLESLLKLS